MALVDFRPPNILHLSYPFDSRQALSTCLWQLMMGKTDEGHENPDEKPIKVESKQDVVDDAETVRFPPEEEEVR